MRTYVKVRPGIQWELSGAGPQAWEPAKPRCSSVPRLPTWLKWLKVERDVRDRAFITDGHCGLTRMRELSEPRSEHAQLVCASSCHCVLHRDGHTTYRQPQVGQHRGDCYCYSSAAKTETTKYNRWAIFCSSSTIITYITAGTSS